MSDKQIVIVTGNMVRGGAQRVISILSNQWVAQGVKVHLVMLIGQDCCYDLDRKVKVTSLFDSKKSRLFQLPRWVRGIRSIVKEEQPDTVLSFFPKISIVTWIGLLGTTCRFVTSERNDPRHDGRSKAVDKLSKFVYSKADAVIFQTEQMRGLYPKCKAERVCVIPNPLSFDPGAMEQRISVPGRIVSVGKLHPQKNQELLISAFAKVSQKINGLTLTIFGNGPLRDKLLALAEEKGVSDRVMLAGNVSDVLDRIADAELFVLSSDYEGFSNALLEALALGVPCVTTDVAGAREMIENGVDGLIVPVGDVDALSSAMESALLDENMRHQFSKNGRQRVGAYGLENVIGKWNDACGI